VVQEEDPHKAAPDERQERAGERSLHEQADQERDRQADYEQGLLGRVYPAHGAVLEQVGRVAAAVGLADGVEEPPDVGVPEAPDPT
jgi:hypothetical protein